MLFDKRQKRSCNVHPKKFIGYISFALAVTLLRNPTLYPKSKVAPE